MRMTRSPALSEAGGAQNEGGGIEEDEQKRCPLSRKRSIHSREYMPSLPEKAISLPLDADRHPVSERRSHAPSRGHCRR